MVDDYDWKYCSGMHVGYTYELHWPHSNMGDCPTADNPWPKWQYQSHFMDGTSHVYCPARTCGSSPRDMPSRLLTSSPQNPSTTPPRVAHLPSTVHVYGSPHHSPPWPAASHVQVIACRRPPSSELPPHTCPRYTLGRRALPGQPDLWNHRSPG